MTRTVPAEEFEAHSLQLLEEAAETQVEVVVTRKDSRWRGRTGHR